MASFKKIIFLLPSLLLLTNLSFAGKFNLPEKSDLVTDVNGDRFITSSVFRGKIKLDGNLNEDAWQNARFQGKFFQREPHLGEMATEKTEVAVLRDHHFLYIGVKCYDSEPSRIIAREMRRDARMDNDDNFQIVLDTYNDKRNGFYFVVNPNGCRRDASFGDEGRSYNSDWDGIWDCGTQVNEKGWFAEIAIPWKTLHFAKLDTANWGVNFSRTIRRKNEQDYWQLIPRDAGRFGMFRLSQAGSLVDLTGMKAGGNIEIDPYTLAGAANDASTDFNTNRVNDFGIDAKIGLTSNLAVNLTWNTDFAQVESDQERVNLTRFSLYFPEKREFFLDGAEVFNFGGQSISGRRGSGNGVRLFYSRRIGIQDGHQQPITGGAKMVGKAGKYQIGFLNMLTEKLSVIDDDDGSEEIFPATNFTVLRLRRELLRRSSIGFMLLNKEELNSTHYNRSGGIDANFPLTDRFTISGAMAGTFGPDEIDNTETIKMNTRNIAGNIDLKFNSDLWDWELSHLSIPENFNAEMGFIRRTDIRSSRAELRYSPRPKKFPSIRQFRYSIEGEYLTDFDNRMLESQLTASFGIRFQNSSYAYFGAHKTAEYIDEDWEVRPGFIIPTDTYYGWDGYAWLSTNESKDISAQLRLSFGDYYTGTRFQASPELTLLNFNRFQAQVNVSLNHVSLPDGSFNARTFGGRFYYYFSTKFYLKAYLQWNDDRLANEGDRISLANLVLRWTYRPGSDLYLVYNERRLFGASAGEVANRTVMLKATFFWRK